MTDTTSAARAAFETWCEQPHTRRARAERRQLYGPFLAGWIASQARRPAEARAVDPDRRCESRLVHPWEGSCVACGAIEGQACQAQRLELARPAPHESRKNSRIPPEELAKIKETFKKQHGG